MVPPFAAAGQRSLSARKAYGIAGGAVVGAVGVRWPESCSEDTAVLVAASAGVPGIPFRFPIEDAVRVAPDDDDDGCCTRLCRNGSVGGT